MNARRLQRLKDVRSRRMADLSQRNASCGYAMKWIGDNQDKFDHEVFFPPAVSLNVSDLRYAPIVEALISHQQMLVGVR
jgi:structural maintenance of chromosomes protein 5